MVRPDKAYFVQATQNDAGRLSRLIRDSFADVAERFELTPQNCPRHPSNYTRKWVERDLSRGVRYYLLIADGTAVGCVGVENPSPTVCYMERLAVLPHHRGQGYGTRLVRQAITHARQTGASTVDIGIIAADAGLKDFYKALGFEEGETKTFPHLPFAVAFLKVML
ncbi:GNAT family N-acetyltransferase [Desulfosarcina sp.]|uniref:GNAT family N-acetyltransferase n=1 Tax=Desulfosarcina sp. TaxID=2027861 RepID=UPI003564327B